MDEQPGGPVLGGELRTSIWPAIHPRILELIRAHKSTIVFTNSRRLAERLAQRLNELAGEDLVRAHHGSIAREQRLEIEEELKAGRLPALVATSSLELGIDMGAVDLVIQVESPTSVSRGLQRVGRAGHQVGEPSKGVIFPKYRGDLLETAVVVRGMRDGSIEPTVLPRNPLDVLAQQLVAMTIGERFTVDELLALVQRAAPFETLSREVLEGVLGMLAGAYPSDEFAELKPRITWDRLTDIVEGRQDARTVAVISGGTIPDRGLFPVFLEGEAGTPGRRVGELDEEMVYELRAGMHGDVIVLGASSWRVAEISANRVTVTPAPGVPGKLPFWKGDTVGRPVELGRAIGAFTRADRGGPREGVEGARDGGRAPPAGPRPRRPRRGEPARLPRGRARGDGRPADRQADRHRALPRRAGRLAARRAHPVRRAGPRAVDDGDRGPDRGAARVRRPDDLLRRRDRDPAAGGRGERPGHRRAAVPGPRRGRGPGGRAGRPVEPVREPVPGERGAGPAPAAAPARDADPAVAAAPAVGRPARRGLPLRLVPDPRGDVPGVPRGRVRPAGAARPAGRRPEARAHDPQRGDRAGVGVREQPAVRLRGRLHVRGRRAARRAPGAGADPRPRPAPRAAGPGGAARAARSGGARGPRAQPPGAGRGPPGQDRGPGPRPPAPARRPHAGRGGGADRRRARRGEPAPRRAGVHAAGGPGADRGRRAVDRDGGRRAVPRRGGRLGPAGRAAGVPRAGRRGPRRAARAVRAHPRPVPRGGSGPPLGPAGRGRRRRAPPPGRRGDPAHG